MIIRYLMNLFAPVNKNIYNVCTYIDNLYYLCDCNNLIHHTMSIRKEQRSGDTIGMNLMIPKPISIELSKRVLDRSAIGMPLTKQELVVEYLEQVIKEDLQFNK